MTKKPVEVTELTLPMAITNLTDYAALFRKGGKHYGKAVEMAPDDAMTIAVSIDKVLECHAAEVADMSRTIRNLSADNDQMAEQETAR